MHKIWTGTIRLWEQGSSGEDLRAYHIGPAKQYCSMDHTRISDRTVDILNLIHIILRRFWLHVNERR